MYPIVDDVEKAQVKIVFGLTGGELEAAPLRYLRPKTWHDGTPTGEHKRAWARYWYVGSPDYAPAIARWWNGDVITIVIDEMFGSTPKKIRARGKVWRKVARYTSSGKAECYYAGSVNNEDAACPICEAEIGDRHGYAYLGDGWSEVVYVAR